MKKTKIIKGELLEIDGRIFSFTKPDTATDNGNLGKGLTIIELYETYRSEK